MAFLQLVLVLDDQPAGFVFQRPVESFEQKFFGLLGLHFADLVKLVLLTLQHAVELFFLDLHRLRTGRQFRLLRLDHPFAFLEFVVTVIQSAFPFVELPFSLMKLIPGVVQ